MKKFEEIIAQMRSNPAEVCFNVKQVLKAIERLECEHGSER
jgi:hypothetical protein